MIKALRNPSLWIAICLLASVWTASSPSLHAESSDEATRRLLEKSLSVIEIDKEISRIIGQQQALKLEISAMESKILLKESDIIQQQENAGQVLRAYYTGERDMMLRALLSFTSLSDLFTMMDYFDWIISRDKNTLNKYKAQYLDLKKDRDSILTEQQRLNEIEHNLVAQRSRVITLQQDIDRDMKGRSDSEQIRIMIEELTNFWQNIGLHEVKQYFSALSAAMQELPKWLNDNKQYLQFKGFEYTLRIPEDELNQFLRSQNDLFDNFAFRFEQGAIKVQGQRDGLNVEITGNYSIEEEPKNAIRFHVDELIFNGLALPDTTRRALEEEFDLGFYPQLIVNFVRAKSVEVTDGEMIVKLKVEL
ncbi:LmeA family phospholipid-binding protein [Paenibacillus abyssi]|uniref:N-terminal domain of peptidoglycan hydrolase CwlO-containing protein n=1 Tax=Paenibacillus abyssi TaxID=1340531 RepID=A0A917D673_9BACL|nr:LmeA family phospholipid-binding protein [Paenibacillus abyssi]GGG10368.1 hypothetical protein GCM10010916_29050 [Paenibacillus abyssi]